MCPIHACTRGGCTAGERDRVCRLCNFVGHKLQTNRSCSFSTRLTYNSKLNAGCVSGICVYRSSAAATPSNCHEKKSMQSTSFGAQSIKLEWKAFSRFFCSTKVANVTHLAAFTHSFCVGGCTRHTRTRTRNRLRIVPSIGVIDAAATLIEKETVTNRYSAWSQ